MAISDMATTMGLESTSSENTTDEFVSTGPNINTVFVVSVIIFCLGICGNTFVILVILKTKSLRSRLPNRFITNQSIIDLCSCFFLIGAVLHGNERLRPDSILDDLYCDLWLSNAFVWCTVYCSTYALMALTFERYFSVVHPVWHKLFFTQQRAYFVMSLTWIFGFIEGVALSMPTSFIDDNGVCNNFVLWPSDNIRVMAGCFTVVLHYILPMSVLIYCYGRMILVIMGRVKKVKPKEGEVPQKKDESWNKAKKNIIVTLTIVGVLFAICWSPNQIYYLMMNLGYPSDFTSSFYNFTVTSIYMNSSVNPYVYIIKYEQFKVAARELLGCPKPTEQASNNEESSTSTTTTKTNTETNTEKQAPPSNS